MNIKWSKVNFIAAIVGARVSMGLFSNITSPSLPTLSPTPAPLTPYNCLIGISHQVTTEWQWRSVVHLAVPKLVTMFYCQPVCSGADRSTRNSAAAQAPSSSECTMKTMTMFPPTA